MLNLLSVANANEQRHALSAFNPETSTWLVSDLKSKFDLQQILLARRPFLPGEAVLRASELWRLLLARVRPDLQVISREFALTLMTEKLSRRPLDWVQAPGAAQTAYEYMSQLMPVLSHPDGQEMMQEWFGLRPASEARWGRWFRLAHELWTEFLGEGFIAPPWVGGVLVNEPGINDVWSRALTVDLGAELNQVEADLLVLLSSRCDVHVLRPRPPWAEEYEKTLAAYDIFDRVANVRRPSRPQAPPSAPGSKDSVSFRKTTTMIAEVKEATAQTRQWLERGVRAERIAIVAPDIECYWPSLSSYLETEGVPTQKDHVRRLHTYPDIGAWLAHLRLKAGAFAEADVELGLFGANENGGRVLSHDRFKTLYSAIYGREDLDRSPHVARLFRVEIGENESVGRDAFVLWALKQLPDTVEFQRVESLCKRLFAECPRVTSLSLKRWLGYLERLAAKIECRIQDGDPNGVACVNLCSAESSPATHMIVLGLTESALKQSVGTAILQGDRMSLAAQFGFHLVSEDQLRLEFAARWLISASGRELVLSVPETDFAGGVEAPSWLWVRGARERGDADHLTVPRLTRWDELQLAHGEDVRSARNWTESRLRRFARSLAEDLGEREPEQFGQGLVRRLSPSAIEDYLDCPFVFAVKHIFCIDDITELDLEVDPSRRGSLMHSVFELLTAEPFRADRSREELQHIVETAREKSGLELADARLWPSLKARYVDLAERFLVFESEYRARLPELHTVARELEVTGYLKPESGELVPERDAGVLSFVGRIDRVDADRSGHVTVMDYKSSSNSVSQHGSWLRKNQIQLLLYAMAVEKGLTALEPRQVLAALYYVARPFDRESGFKVDDVEQGLYETGDAKKKNRISSKDKKALFSEGRELIRSVTNRILAGDFRPSPRDQKNCADCQWSALCRAPHLNS